jgi:hypothetical protein
MASASSGVLKHHHQHLYQTPQSPLPYPTSEHISSYDHPSLQQQYPFSPLPHRTTQLSPGKSRHTGPHLFSHSLTHAASHSLYSTPILSVSLSDFNNAYDSLMFISGLAFFIVCHTYTSLSLSYLHIMDTHIHFSVSCVSAIGGRRNSMGVQCLGVSRACTD